MEDEYGKMTSEGDKFTIKNFKLESGETLPTATLNYRTYGALNEAKDNVIVVCHALTGNASLDGWWGGLLGEGKAFDTNKYLVVCCNILGSCYGSTSPTSIDPSTSLPYGITFPDVSVQDGVRLQLALLKEGIGASSIKSVIGGSFGGMQTLEFAVQTSSPHSPPNPPSSSPKPYVRSCIPIACGTRHTAWQIGISEVQRQCIYKDPKWLNGNFTPTDPPRAGLELARQIGMISYRTKDAYDNKFGRETKNGVEYGKYAHWEVKSYLEYQGEKFLERFDPITYIKLTEQMDSHDVGRGRGGCASALGQVKIPVCVMGIDSDVLYPIEQQREIYDLLGGGGGRKFIEIKSEAGHDGFLLEQEQVGRGIQEFLDLIE
ncbi:hypothetical protein TrCOL_g10540 [Triparma columacea]|uniref:AB hydrolase-1 domain-containing protein n=1 Tax=Triparma columacea TaxID=722753 RepID=A0A9W7GK72_9STRA|nr:hypothetical protein TrCOL_g10540 [Triparma columacea]